MISIIANGLRTYYIKKNQLWSSGLLGFLHWDLAAEKKQVGVPIIPLAPLL